MIDFAQTAARTPTEKALACNVCHWPGKLNADGACGVCAPARTIYPVTGSVSIGWLYVVTIIVIAMLATVIVLAALGR